MSLDAAHRSIAPCSDRGLKTKRGSRNQIGMFVRLRSTVFRAATAHFQCFMRQHVGVGQQLGLCSVAKVPKEVREYNVPVPWGHIAVKEWGPADGKPVVCLHGWMDNANTFEPLISILPSHYRYLSFDFPGHGLSSHRPIGTFYGPAEYANDVVRIVEHLKLDRFPMMGHSMGGRMCFITAAVIPDKVSKIISIDEGSPPLMPIESQPQDLVIAIEEEMKNERKRSGLPRSYLRDEALELLMSADLTKVTAEVLIKRGFRPTEDGSRLVLNRDPRLRNCGIFVSMSYNLISFIYKSCKKDLLLFFSTNSSFKITQDPDGSFRETFAKNCRSYKFVEVEGKHHIHIDHREYIAPHVIDFLEHDAH